jgi:hypothetical protein
MHNFSDLTDDNFIMYAIKCYNTPNCIMSEFEEDMKRLKYIKRLIKRYRATGDLKERLLLNHMIVLSNVFGTEAAVRLLFFKADEQDFSILKTFLLLLNYMPKIVLGIKGRDIISADIVIDVFVAKRLRDNI